MTDTDRPPAPAGGRDRACGCSASTSCARSPRSTGSTCSCTRSRRWEKEYVDGLDRAGEHARRRRAASPRPASCTPTEPIDGVLCWDEARILQTAHVAEALGLPGGDPAMISRCRDKHLTRVALAAAGRVRSRSRSLVEHRRRGARRRRDGRLPGRAQAARAGGQPRRGEGRTRRRAARRSSPSPTTPTVPGGAALRRPGPRRGVRRRPRDQRRRGRPPGPGDPLFCLARKELGYPPYAEEIGHFVDAADPLLADPRAAARCWATHTPRSASRDGITHTEIMLTADGPEGDRGQRPARRRHDPVPRLQATGVDPGLAAAAVACGRTPAWSPDRALVGGVRFFYVERERHRDRRGRVRRGRPARHDRPARRPWSPARPRPAAEGHPVGPDRLRHRGAPTRRRMPGRAGRGRAGAALVGGKVKEPDVMTCRRPTKHRHLGDHPGSPAGGEGAAGRRLHQQARLVPADLPGAVPDPEGLHRVRPVRAGRATAAARCSA